MKIWKIIGIGVAAGAGAVLVHRYWPRKLTMPPMPCSQWEALSMSQKLYSLSQAMFPGVQMDQLTAEQISAINDQSGKNTYQCNPSSGSVFGF